MTPTLCADDVDADHDWTSPGAFLRSDVAAAYDAAVGVIAAHIHPRQLTDMVCSDDGGLAASAAAALERQGVRAVPALCELAASGSALGAELAALLLGRVGEPSSA